MFSSLDFGPGRENPLQLLCVMGSTNVKFNQNLLIIRQVINKVKNKATCHVGQLILFDSLWRSDWMERFKLHINHD